METNKQTKLTAKQEAFALYYATPGSETEHNGQESARKANYKGNDKTLSVVASENIAKPYIKKRIEEIKAVIAEKLDFNRDTAIKLLNKNIEYLTPKAESGDTQAITSLTAVIRELSAISNLHATNMNINNITKDIPQSEKEIEAGEEAAKIFKLRLANG